MAAITFTQTPPRNYLQVGFWQELKDRLETAKSIIDDSSTDYNPATNTVNEFSTAIDAVIAAISGVL